MNAGDLICALMRTTPAELAALDIDKLAAEHRQTPAYARFCRQHEADFRSTHPEWKPRRG